MHASVISVDCLGEIEVPLLKVDFVEEALKVGQDEAVGALTSTIALGMVGRGARLLDAL